MTKLNEQKNRSPRRRYSWFWVVCLILAFVVGGLYWLSSGLNHLFGSIVGGSSIGVSQSMELHELKFRTSAKDVTPLEAESLPRKEWILNIPRAYVVSMIGENGADGPDDSFIVRLEVVFDPLTEKTSPLDNANKSKSMSVKLINGAFPSALSKVDYCVRYDDLFAFMTKFGSDYPYGGKCDKNSARCEVFANIDGWPIRMYMPRSVYFSDPQPACRAVEELLSKYSTRRDIVN